MKTHEIEHWLRSLTPLQQRTVTELTTATALWLPQSVPQWQAILSEADELFYGGQAGGGKTDLILGAAVTQHRDSVIFRREYRQMVGARGIIDRSREIIGKAGRYNGQDHVWRDLPGGRSIEFGSMQFERDKHAWQGRPHDLKAFDEITEFLKANTNLSSAGIARRTGAALPRHCHRQPAHQPGRALGDRILGRVARRQAH